MKNRLTALLACAICVALLFGCTRATKQPETTSTVTSTTAAVTTETTKETTKTTKAASTTAQTTSKKVTTTKARKNTTAKSNTARSEDTIKLFDALFKSLREGSRDRRSIATTNNNSEHTQKSISNDDADYYCTVTIQCKEILSNRDKLKDGHEEFVPKSGYLVRNYSVKYENDDNVYKVVQRVCRENGIKMRAKKTAYGMYIVGLNELDEKDCGGTSGWTYYVDGKFPNVSVDNYSLKGGESIELKYVV